MIDAIRTSVANLLVTNLIQSGKVQWSGAIWWPSSYWL